MIYTDNKDFYPTPKALFNRLLGDNIRWLGGKILEPSAGKGDMIRYIKERMGRRENYNIDAIENDERLVSHLIGESISVVWDDFLTYETFKEYDYIIMNPPFSNGVKHVLKAIELAENQITDCCIFAIINKQTLANAYSNDRQTLLSKLDEYNADIEYVSEAFMDAERKTDVEVALIRAHIKSEDKGRSIYDSIPIFNATEVESDALETALSTHVQASEVADKLDDIERLVAEYEKAVEVARTSFEAAQAKQSFYSYINEVNKREDERIGSELYSLIPHGKEVRREDYNEELDRLRRGYWSLILDTRDFRELLTNEAIQKINRQLSSANNLEINYANIRMLLMSLYQNQNDILIDSIVSIFKKITRYHMNEYSTNIHYYDGWKTNDAYRINKKIIIPISHAFDAWDLKDEYERLPYDVKAWLGDIIKALRLLDDSVENTFEYAGNNEFENDWLRFKMFKNGNIHVWFKDEALLNRLNYLCGQHFAWIPSEGEQEESEEARRWAAKEFGDIGEVKLLQEATE